MRIGIDVSAAVSQRGGIGRYTKELVKNLLKIDNLDSFSLFSFYGDEREFIQEVKAAGKAKFKSRHFPGRLFRLMLFSLYKSGLSPDFLLKQIDVFHSPDHIFPACKKIPTILTIHDLAFLLYPENYTRINRTYLRMMIPQSVKQATKIIAVSKNTKEDVVRLFRVKENKVSVIYNGVESIFRPMSKDNGSEIRERYHLPADGYILYVGTLEPRKNVGNLIRAYSETKRKERIPYKLVICGGKGWLYRKLFDLVDKLNLRNEIIFTGYIPNEDLPAIYSGAEFLVYPSIYEGFGLPPLEAMACGTPVICSSTSSLPEVVGDAALLINPNDIGEIEEAMLSLLSDEDLKRELRETGLKRAAKFSWEKTAKETLEVYKSVVAVRS